MSLLVVAGEGSGDALAAPVLGALRVEAFGVGGPALAGEGAELVADLRSFSAMGFRAVVGKAPALARAGAALVSAVRRRRPRAALLVGLSEPNARLARWLGGRGVRVLWYAPPQVWAWRPGRARRIARTDAHLGLLLPFEPAVWERAGARASYVGHPALHLEPAVPAANRNHLALLPGSREHEIRHHLSALLGCARRTDIPSLLVRAPSLPDSVKDWMAHEASAVGVPVTDEPVERALSGARAAVVASGTATLECAALGVPPVVVHRTDAVTFAIARRLVRVPYVGLPNLVLGRRAFPELLQGDANPRRIAFELARVLAAPSHFDAACAEVRARLTAGLDARRPADRVAAILEPWLS